jgi:hypothetical protein
LLQRWEATITPRRTSAHQPLFINSDAIVNITRMHIHVPLERSWSDSYQHWWYVRFERSAALLSVLMLLYRCMRCLHSPSCLQSPTILDTRTCTSAQQESTLAGQCAKGRATTTQGTARARARCTTTRSSPTRTTSVAHASSEVSCTEDHSSLQSEWIAVCSVWPKVHMKGNGGGCTHSHAHTHTHVTRYRGAYFFGEFVKRKIQVLTFAEDGSSTVTNSRVFDQHWSGEDSKAPAHLSEAPDGSLWYITDPLGYEDPPYLLTATKNRRL